MQNKMSVLTKMHIIFVFVVSRYYFVSTANLVVENLVYRSRRFLLYLL